MRNNFRQGSIAFSFLGSGPDRGRSPVEWGDFPFVRRFIHPSVRPFPPLGQPAMPEAQPARSETQPASQTAKPQSSGMAGWASDLAG